MRCTGASSVWAGIALALLAVGCRGFPRPAPRSGTLWGYATLERREGVKPTHKHDPVYKDPRFANVETVDYGKPGFMLVYLEGPPSPAGTTVFAIGDAREGFDRKSDVVGVGGEIVLTNVGSRRRVVSCPDAGLLEAIEPSHELRIAASKVGAWEVSLVDSPVDSTLVFVSPGPFTIVSESGLWALRDVSPARGTIHVWHPRLPGTSRPVEVLEGVVTRADLVVSVDNLRSE